MRMIASVGSAMDGSGTSMTRTSPASYMRVARMGPWCPDLPYLHIALLHVALEEAMDPRRLLTFRVVAHERSFSRAAERLSRSQPSVSSQIALLETEIGVRLFERGRRGLRLTPAGEVLIEHADHVAWRLQLADTQIAALSDDRRDQVRLGSFPTALAGFVPSAVARLRLTHSDLRVLLSEVTPSTLERRFL